MIPAELRELRQWVLWRYEEREGKRTKVPCRANKPTVRASSTDPDTWSTHEDALRAAGTDGMDGIGFVFTESDPYAGVDLDHCVDGEDINPHAANVLRELDSYSEFSPSGTGLHVIVRATVNGGRNRTGKTPWAAEFENYDRGRFFCMTGRHVPDTPRAVCERQRQLDAVRAKMFPPPAAASDRKSAPGASADDRDLLALASRAKNGADFDALYRGQHPYGSQSEADLALCNMLAFWFGPDHARIDRLFRASGLMREKWDAARGDSTYGAQTVARALEGRTEFYTPAEDGKRPPGQLAPGSSAKAGFTKASTIKPRRIRWLRRGWLAFGYLSLWSGESSLGKSTFSCSLFADLTHGTLPGHLEGEPSNVLIVASEDARGDMWVPRLMAAGADLERVQFLDQDREWNLRDGQPFIERALDEGDAKLVFIDSVLEVLPEPGHGESINSAPFVRRSLGPTSDMLKNRNIAGLVSTHPPKGKGSTFQDSVMASAAFVHVTRVGLLFAWHPDDLDLPDQERRRVLMRPPGGSNIGRDPGSFEFRVLTKDILIEGEPEEVPYTSTLEPTDVTYRDLTRAPKEDKAPTQTEVAGAEALIDSRLADGKWHPSMIDELLEKGFSRSTAYRAAEPVEKHKAPTDGKWWWASNGTPKSSFVEVAGNMGPSRARARTPSQPGTFTPKTTTNGSVEGRSHVPAELDETTPQTSVDGEGPTWEEATRARAGTLAEQIVAELGSNA
jgi:putative DNA primase/helicase